MITSVSAALDSDGDGESRCESLFLVGSCNSLIVVFGIEQEQTHYLFDKNSEIDGEV